MKLHTTVLAACLAACLPTAFAASPNANPSALPVVPRGGILQPTAAQIPALCEASLADAKARIEALKTLPLDKATAKTVLTAWNGLDIVL